MNKRTFYDLLNFIVYTTVGVGAMLFLIHFLGEVHGLIASVVIFIGQTGWLFMQVRLLERQLREAQQAASPGAAP